VANPYLHNHKILVQIERRLRVLITSKLMLATAAQSTFHVGRLARFELSQELIEETLNILGDLSQLSFLAVLSSSSALVMQKKNKEMRGC
jgi:hypothetical protein